MKKIYNVLGKYNLHRLCKVVLVDVVRFGAAHVFMQHPISDPYPLIPAAGECSVYPVS